MRKLLLLVATALAICLLCRPGSRRPGPAGRPRLVVFIAIDGLPQRQVVDYRDQLAPDGFAPLPRSRRVVPGCALRPRLHRRRPPGHATMLTGAYPHRTGIIGNEWRDPRHRRARVLHRGYPRTLHRPQDREARRHQPEEPAGRDGGRRAASAARSGSKVITISGKDRGAILPAGKRGTAYMYQGDRASSPRPPIYMQAPSGVGGRLQRRQAGGPLLQAEWKPLLPEAAYARSLPRQPAVVRRARRRAADGDGHAARSADAGLLRARCCPAPLPTRSRSTSPAPRSRARRSAPTTRPTSCR